MANIDPARVVGAVLLGMFSLVFGSAIVFEPSVGLVVVFLWRGGPVGVSEAVRIIRKRALAAGARLDPVPPSGTRPPRGWRGWFFGR